MDRLAGDVTCLCGEDYLPDVGDSIHIGSILGFGLEPQWRYARVVGFCKPHVRGMKTIVRLFRPGDGRWPTGEYARQGLNSPWWHDHPQTELRPDQVPDIGEDFFPKK